MFASAYAFLRRCRPWWLALRRGPSGLSADEQRTYEQLDFFYTKGIGYGIEMITQPQTLYGIADSPVGLAAWMINHDQELHRHRGRGGGAPVGNLTRDEVLDNVTFYWLTDTAISSTRLYWENTFGFFGVKGVSMPAAVDVFPKEIYKAPRSWAERAYSNLIYFNEVDAGCHFAAWQEAAAVHRRAARGVPVTSLDGRARPYAHAFARRGGRVAQLRATRPRRAARPRRPRQLLDADVHQLATPGAIRSDVVADLPGRRARRDRRPHAGVLVRA